MISPTLIEETLCRLPDTRYAAVVVDRDRGRRIAVIIPWPGKSIDQAGYLRAVAAEYGQAVATSLLLLPRDTIPLTSQGKPDREAIRAIGPGWWQQIHEVLSNSLVISRSCRYLGHR